MQIRASEYDFLGTTVRICIMGEEIDTFQRSVVISEIKMCSGYQIQIRASEHYFPETTDRICIMGGEMDDFERRVVIT